MYGSGSHDRWKSGIRSRPTDTAYQKGLLRLIKYQILGNAFLITIHILNSVQ